MAQDLDSIIKELDASYNPSRQAINDRINGLGAAEQADVADLQGQQKNAFDDITSGSIARGVFYGGAPIAEQQKYTSRNFLPAVAKVKQQYVANRGSLVDSLNSLNMDQHKTALSLQQQQQDRDFQREQAEAARRAASAQGDAFSGLLSGAGQQTQQAPADTTYAKVDKNQANAAIKQLLATNNPQIIAKTINAISTSASRGNVYDKYKLELLQSLQGNSSYGSLLNKVANVNAHTTSNKVTF